MKQYAAMRCSPLRPVHCVAAALTLSITPMTGCGPRELPAETLPEPKPAAAAPVSTERAGASAAPAQGESVPNATVTATIQGDPFAKVDVAADDRLRQILRLSDKPRAPVGKRAPQAALRLQNIPPTAPAGPARPARPADTLDTAPSAPTATVPQPAAAPTPAPETAAPVAVVASSTAPAEPPRAPVLRAIERSQPPFPPEAQRDGVFSGRVIAAITVLPDGTVGQVDIIEASPERVFDRAVRNALLRWRFEPVPQPVRANVEIVFNAE